MAEISLDVVVCEARGHVDGVPVDFALAAAPRALICNPLEGPDSVLGGIGVIVGLVELAANPENTKLKRKVRLHRDVDGMLVRETWSDAVTGAYAFAYIDPAYKYTAIAYDYEHNYRAEAADNLTPEVLP